MFPANLKNAAPIVIERKTILSLDNENTYMSKYMLTYNYFISIHFSTQVTSQYIIIFMANIYGTAPIISNHKTNAALASVNTYMIA